MTEKWIVYHGDAYYPGVYVYASEEEAKTEWEKLKHLRDELDDKKYVDIDYIAKVIDEYGEDRTI